MATPAQRMQDFDWCPGRGSNPYALFREAADFKSAVSTSFTTRANGQIIDRLRRSLTRARSAKLLDQEKRPRCLARPEEFGGATQSRTGLDGFAIRCITDLLSRRRSNPLSAVHSDKKGKPGLPFFLRLEREKSLELSTSTLARLRSTN